MIGKAEALNVNSVLLKGKTTSEDIQKTLEQAITRRDDKRLPRLLAIGYVGIRLFAT